MQIFKKFAIVVGFKIKRNRKGIVYMENSILM